MQTKFLQVIVEKVKIETSSVKSFTLVPPRGERLPGFSAGSHVTTYIENNGKKLERHYSLASNPEIPNEYVIGIRKSESSRGGSEAWHECIKEGDRLFISNPKNHFPLSFRARKHVFFAAGIGITPFIAMMFDLKKRGIEFELHYAARSKELCPFFPLINEHFPEHSHFYFSELNNRMLPDLMKEQPIGTHVYFCGPELMVKQFSQRAHAYGYPKANVHFELFSPPDMGPKTPFHVKLSKSKKEFYVSETENLLDVLLDGGVDASYSCRVGGCGSCQLNVKEGVVDHRDQFLSDEEKKTLQVILPCVSRAKSKTLVLDI
ncbi:PDR/VanB family oxidoreductase [Aquibacillus albus]|uniref:Ferredoxin-NADP reductase n=1 Tax=Aquibacillus albus TaxID=1168171 RepID=A0ABS2MWN5_9BACI|nr:PDR/VanB family oxidoreductase [Aquibacillus albus]MBM7570188.1 ferredoxin-NADP reductase [Aquibacillus albus]